MPTAKLPVEWKRPSPAAAYVPLTGDPGCGTLLLNMHLTVSAVKIVTCTLGAASRPPGPGHLLGKRATGPPSPPQRCQRRSHGPAATGGEDAFVLLRRYAGDRDRPTGAARPGRPTAGAGMTAALHQVLAAAVTAYRNAYPAG